MEILRLRLGAHQMKHITLIAAMTAAVACSQSPATVTENCETASVFYFDAVSRDGTDNRRMFIDLANARHGVVNNDSLATESHQAGYIYNCSNEEIYCIAAGFVFAMPKDDQRTFGLGQGRHCEMNRASTTTTVNCFVDGNLVQRFRRTESGIDQVEVFFPDYPEFNSVFRSVSCRLPFPLKDSQAEALPVDATYLVTDPR